MRGPSPASSGSLPGRHRPCQLTPGSGLATNPHCCRRPAARACFNLQDTHHTIIPHVPGRSARYGLVMIVHDPLPAPKNEDESPVHAIHSTRPGTCLPWSCPPDGWVDSCRFCLFLPLGSGHRRCGPSLLAYLAESTTAVLALGTALRQTGSSAWPRKPRDPGAASCDGGSRRRLAQHHDDGGWCLPPRPPPIRDASAASAAPIKHIMKAQSP